MTCQEGIGSFLRGRKILSPRCVVFIFLHLGSEEKYEILAISQGFIIL
jgi:hypothetical protein